MASLWNPSFEHLDLLQTSALPAASIATASSRCHDRPPPLLLLLLLPTAVVRVVWVKSLGFQRNL